MGLGFYDLDNDVVMTLLAISQEETSESVCITSRLFIFFLTNQRTSQRNPYVSSPQCQPNSGHITNTAIPLHGIKIVQVIKTLCSLKPTKGIQVANSCVRPWLS